MHNRVLLLFLLCSQFLSSQVHQWRGNDRSGIYPDVSLLDTFPLPEPEMCLNINDAGMGYGSPSITTDGIYLAGTIDSIGYIYKYNHEGVKLWQTEYGQEFTYKYIGSRGTPSIEGDRLYYSGSYGDAICLDTKTGQKKWHKNIFDLYGGKPIKWGYTESPLIVNNKLILTPGGEGYNIVALSTKDGRLIWKKALRNTVNAYCSPKLIFHKAKIYALLNTSNALLLFDPGNGDIFIKHELTDRRLNHSMAPLYKDNQIFYSSGYGEGSVMFSINEEKKQLDTLWINSDFDCKLSGMICYGGLIYGTSDRKKQWMAISWNTGETQMVNREIKAGSIIMADGKFYLFSEIGELALAHPTPTGFVIKSKFNIPVGRVSLAFSHPVIYKAQLYVRYNNHLWAYKLN